MDNQTQKMNSQQIELYQRIQAFSLDETGAHLSFSKRLAKDNGWSLEYTQRVIKEYKKFAFLAVAAGHRVVPSYQVDRVWHLHLIYTRSYWQEFCSNVLQKPLHHEPSRGGLAEKTKFESWYDQTLESYRHFFEQVPPVDIWPDSKERSGRDLHFIRVNTQQNWVIPKLNLPLWFKVKPNHALIFFLLLSLTLTLTSCQAIGLFFKSFTYQASDFLYVYIFFSAFIFYLASYIRFLLRLPDGNPIEKPVCLTIYETAYLVGRKKHVVNTAIVSLIQQKIVTVQPKTRMLTLEKPVLELSEPIEETVAKAIELSGKIDTVWLVEAPSMEKIRERLQQLNLQMTSEQSSQAQNYSTLLIMALLGLGIAKILIGIYRHKSVIELFIFCIVIAICGWSFWRTPVHERSRYGERILLNLRSSERPTEEIKPTGTQLLLAFALEGSAILPNDIFADLKKLLPSLASADSGETVDCCGD